MSAIDTIGGGNIEPRGLEDEMRSAYLDYAMSVIVGRALPDVRDGLKPVHRRVLYVMNEMGLQPTRKHVKCAQIVGEVMGKYHPHGDSAIYDTLARMAQDFSMRYPLVDGHGNFGNIDGWGAAAMRYTEARLARLATEMLRDIDAETVDFAPTYDGSRQEPVVLPARFPNLLVNGGSGIAVGMATNIPPHNLREVIDATIAYIDDPEIDVDALMKHIKGPDFPTAGIILGRSGIRDAYATGRGRVRVQAKAHIEPIGQGKEAIIVTELPVPGPQGRRRRADREDPRPRARQEDPGDLRPARRVRPARDAARDRAQARRDPQGRAQQAPQAHADADDVRRQHGRARRQRAADAVAARGARPLRRPPARGDRPPDAVRAAPRRGPRARVGGPADRARQPRRGDRADPRIA